MERALTAGVPGIASDRTSTHIEYQPALDGLRGLAVAAVLAYHNESPWMPGGYVGVDVFFVLSGFLITSLLVVERRRSGRIALGSFWLRRARRLLPALFLLLLLVAAYARFAAASTQLHSIRLDGIAALFYVENWRLVFSHQSYFDQFNAPSPLRHVWSLAIEEQWYLLWPPALVLLLRRWRGDLRRVLHVVVALAACSAALTVVLFAGGASASRVYYGTDTRAQALLVGSALAIAVLSGRLPGVLRRVRVVEALGILAAAYLVWMACAVHDNSTFLYRGGLTLAAVAAAGVVHAGTAADTKVVRRTLSVAPLRWLGLISYGVYLYHWPIFLWLDAARTGLHGASLLLVRSAVTLAVSAASYYLVERPIRRGAAGRTLARIAIPVGAVITVTSLVVATASSAGVGDAALADSGPSRNGAFRVLVVGDSQSVTLGRAGPTALRELGLDYAFRGKLGCGIVPDDIYAYGHVVSLGGRCADWLTLATGGVATLDPQVSILLTGTWERLDHRIDGAIVRFGSSAYRTYLLHQLDEMVRVLTARGGRVALLTVPCLAVSSTAPYAASLDDPTRTAWLNMLFRSYAASHSTQVHLVDIDSLLCRGNQARTRIGGVVVRDDGLHFTPAGATLVWRWLLPQLRTIASGNVAATAPPAAAPRRAGPP